MKMLDVKNAEKALRKLAQADLPVVISFQLIGFIDDVDKELSTFESVRIKLIKKYGEKDKNGNLVVGKDNIDDFNKDMSDLLNTNIEFNVKSIGSDVLLSIDGLSLSVSEIKALQNIGIIDG